MKAYISQGKDRESNTTWEASVCDDGAEIDFITGYDREALEKEITAKHGDIEIE